jgi:UDP:flavonoid glycosyltransferase YjiC (YdhE family)
MVERKCANLDDWRAVFPLASAVVCHGGHGTVMKALAHGLPVVVMPFGRDQKDNGARVVVAGAGLSLSPNASPARIAVAIRRVLEEPGFREGAQRMAAIIGRDVKEDRAVVEMEALTTRHQSSTPVVARPSQLGRSARAGV